MPFLPLFPIMAARPPYVVLMLGLLLAGCQPLMSASPTDNPAPISRADNTVADWPFRFKRHNFGAACYSTYGCKLVYADLLHLDQPEDELQPSSESIGSDYRENFGAGRAGIVNFPPPAAITWRSKDGTLHRAEVDMAAIFKDELILHNVPREDVLEDTSVGDPEIILEVNDRTINVYMKAFISIKSLRMPGNPHSDYRNDLILAYTRTY
ncbi:MAG TPA: hypothetical protein VEY92_00960 [Pseudoxanthomonas sp.]|nr:hypothetical protein [Pseudoxanthomonas sp.]